MAAASARVDETHSPPNGAAHPHPGPLSARNKKGANPSVGPAQEVEGAQTPKPAKETTGSFGA
eukprot:6202450-Alexandrium_andersonii.AAC.1